MILGLDISTSCIGWCLLRDDGSVEDINYIDLRLDKNFYLKCDIFWSEIKNHFHHRYGDVKEVWVEEPVKMFQSNASMAQTIAKLQRFNAACCLMLYNFFDKEPKMIMASSARKLAGVKIPKGTRGKETKAYILGHVRSLKVIPESTWSYKKTGNPKDFCYDMADSYVVARAGYEQTKTTTITP